MNIIRSAWLWVKRLFRGRRRGAAPTTGPSMAVIAELVLDSSSGAFFKLDGGELLSGPHFVHAPTFSLYRSERSTYTYPVDGWFWFDSELEARRFFGLKEDV